MLSNTVRLQQATNPNLALLGEDAYERLVEPHRAGLRAYCRRLLGSPYEADEALQETMLRAWRGLPGFEGRAAIRNWLYRIARNVCTDHAAMRRPLVLCGELDAPADGGPAEPVDLVERAEAVESALIVAFECLDPYARAVLIQRDVLDFSARETAATLDRTVTAVNSALQRARERVGDAVAGGAGATGGGADRLTRAAARAYAAALRRGDVDELVDDLARAGRPVTRRAAAGRRTDR